MRTMTEIDKTKLVQDTASLGDFNRNVVEEFRANGGKVGGPFEGGNLLLLHTTGAKSGQPRLSPLAYLTIDGKMLIIGSYAGAPKDPAWVHNLRATPKAHIEVGTESYDVTVRELRPGAPGTPAGPPFSPGRLSPVGGDGLCSTGGGVAEFPPLTV
ncbi:MAG: deazaflavin-dependent nitroreductase family protein [Mycobacterium sp.]|nr:deazaflavin-dependent nitroreductase family protein [Mycobacterium sp.]MDT5312218.1 hypothetical protein [Mycobacterium sp.]